MQKFIQKYLKSLRNFRVSLLIALYLNVRLCKGAHTQRLHAKRRKKITKLQQIQYACQTQLTSAKDARVRNQRQYEENKRALTDTHAHWRA